MSEEKQYTLTPVGFYDATVTGEVKYGKGAKGEQAAIQVVMQMPDGAQRMGWAILSFSDDAMKYSMEKLTAIGWPGGNTLIEKCAGAKCRISVKHEMYDGKEREKLDIVTGGGFAFRSALDDQEKANFFQRLSQYTPPANGTKAASKAAGYPANWDQGTTAPGAGVPDDFSLD